ncbi:MAG: DUF1926 domain-containing protein [Spirochaetota bacterium]|nr:DUF1926 domain-containing protein [Spirochaetota bacterium]
MIHFVLGIHCHQPVGNFDFVFESAHNKSYYPFLKMLSQFPNIKCTVHYSGVLFDWVKLNKPETHELIVSLTKRNQLEIMTGGFYEPILTTISEEDQIGQIKMLTNYIKNEFQYDPKGLWLTERIWEPHLPRILYNAGIKYVTVDDSHLKQSGILPENLYNYFITEELGYNIMVFPISEELRYLIPFQDPEKTISFLKNIDKDGVDKVVVLADDGEKFGDWPGTYDWVYNKGWLNKFFNLLMENQDWLKTRTFSEVLNDVPPKDKVYMTTASYEEMMGWALPTSKALDYKIGKKYVDDNSLVKQFYRGGFWRNFLTKYPESNLMYSKMQLVSKKVNSLENSDIKNEALKELWQGQCNCAYWHGEFGGNYLNHLRNAVYKHLIAAENLADKHFTQVNPSIIVSDYNSDGYNEILVSNKNINTYFSELGGQLIELDVRNSKFNFLDTFTRKEEAYHHILLNETGKKGNENKSDNGIDSIHDLEKKRDKDIVTYLKYDWYNRYAFIDHFFDEHTDINQVKDCSFIELGDFVSQRYKSEINALDKNVQITFTKNGTLNYLNQTLNISVKKTYSITEKGINADYEIKNNSDKDINCFFGIEFNFTVLTGYANDRYYLSNVELDDKRPISQGVSNNVTHIELKDEYQKSSVRLNFNEPVELWRFPIETVSQSVDSYEHNYQASCIIPRWIFSLKKDEIKKINFHLSVINEK